MLQNWSQEAKVSGSVNCQVVDCEPAHTRTLFMQTLKARAKQVSTEAGLIAGL